MSYNTLLQAVDAAFLQLTVGKTLQRSASVHLLFAFEYVIQVRRCPVTERIHVQLHRFDSLPYAKAVCSVSESTYHMRRWQSSGLAAAHYIFHLRSARSVCSIRAGVSGAVDSCEVHAGVH